MPSRRATAPIAALPASRTAVTDRELQRLHAGGIRGIRFNFVKHLGGRAGPGCVSSPARAHQASGMACRAAFRCRRHLDAARICCGASTCPSSSITWAGSRRPTASSSGRFSCCSICTATIRWPGSRSAAPSGCPVGKRPFRDAVPFARALIAVDSQRILWGTDWPHPNISKDMPNDGELVDLFAEICPDPAMRQRILVDNPTRMYWAD